VGGVTQQKKGLWEKRTHEKRLLRKKAVWRSTQNSPPVASPPACKVGGKALKNQNIRGTLLEEGIVDFSHRKAAKATEEGSGSGRVSSGLLSQRVV